MVGKIQSTPPQKENTKPQELSLAQMQTPCNFLNPPFFFFKLFFALQLLINGTNLQSRKDVHFYFLEEEQLQLTTSALGCWRSRPERQRLCVT